MIISWNMTCKRKSKCSSSSFLFSPPWRKGETGYPPYISTCISGSFIFPPLGKQPDPFKHGSRLTPSFHQSDKSFAFTSDATAPPPSFPPPYLQSLYDCYIWIKNANVAGASQSLGWPILQLMMGHSVGRRAGMKENLNEADPHTKARPVGKTCSLPTK